MRYILKHVQSKKSSNDYDLDLLMTVKDDVETITDVFDMWEQFLVGVGFSEDQIFDEYRERLGLTNSKR